jgi:RNA polymerase sigma-70 factor (ECF subfamily)
MKTNETNSPKTDFIVMIEKRKGLIYKIANAYSRSSEDLEDLVQEIILQLWSSFGNYDPKFKITTWIYRIALNVSITHYRKDVVRKKYTIPMTEQFIESSYTEKDNQADDIRQLKKFIQELDEMNRALMILYLDGNSHQEISNVLNISVSNAGTKISRIKEKLREKFKK